MSRLYNRHFKVGVGFNIVLFAILNFFSYVIAHRKSEIKFSGGVYWGLPFSWTADPLALVLNVAVIPSCSFIGGFVFRYLLTKGEG